MVRVTPVPWSTHVNVVFLLCLFFHQSYYVYANIPISYSPIDNVALNCGASGNKTAPDGRPWSGDIGSKFSKLHQPNGKSVTLKSFLGSDAHSIIPYNTARISRSQFTYTFVVNPGQKFIRLHFYPVSYPGFERSNAFFTVKAGPYTLLSNFSPSLTADYIGSKYLVKEFCLNVEENRELTISFIPSPRTFTSRAVYAFINGIEVVSMPTALYYTHHDDLGAYMVGQNRRFYIENKTALEMVHRLNIGGSSVSAVQDSGMFREWSQDSRYLIESGVVPIITTIPVTYTSIPAYSAPQKVYQSIWSTESSKQSNKMNNFTWKLPVDLGFRYLVRMHFCELEYGVKETGQREFSISINKQTAETCADVMEWSGGIGVAVYKDYVIMMEGDRMQGKHDLVIALQPHCNDYNAKHAIGPILNGLEVFKLSNPDNNLAGPNPVPVLISKSSKVHKPQKSCLPYIWNAVINSLIISIIVVNITVHYLRVLAENSGKENISKSCPKAICRLFSLLEMQTATNNFDDALIIGCGGFGKVYRGIIDEGATTVAIKRLNPASNQGALEFWTEIEMLSNLRHNHLLTLLGYCKENVEMILVYEYMAHGTLADHLYKNRRNNDGLPCLNWEERLSICIGAARGLNFLHISDPKIIHRDVKSTNILLDESWVAKISDFGLSKMGISNQSRSYISTNVKGTYGYLDPEYYLTRRLTRKSDVYAFGVVLLEVLCGRPPVDTRLDEEQHSLALWARQCIREGNLDQLIDPYLGTQISPGCLKLFAELAKVCLCKYPKNRPTMNDVLDMLELSLASQRGSSSCIEEEAVDTGSSVNEEAGENNQSSDLPVQQADGPTLEQDGTPSSRRKSKYTVSMVVKSMTLMLRGKDQNRKRKRKTSSSGSSSWSWWPKALRYKINRMETNIPRVLKDPEFYRGRAHRFSLKELQIATDNFSGRNVIGRGGFGKVYKGRLPDGSLVAVKRRKAELTLGGELQFDTELELISMAVHRNLLRLRGFCITPTERILVYPFMVNGSLASCLRERSDAQPSLDWTIRKRIALDAATGLTYLHEHCVPTIIHRDVKAANILLDEDFEAVVGDFGLVKLMDDKYTHVTTAIRGTVGHIALEYLATGHSSKKTDVYGYGMMLLELITGQKAFDLARLANDEDAMLLDWVKHIIREKKIEMMVDADLRGNYLHDELEQLLQLAILCTQDSPMKRPKMSEVVRMLLGDGLVERWNNWTKEEIWEPLPCWIVADSTNKIPPEELSGPR